MTAIVPYGMAPQPQATGLINTVKPQRIKQPHEQKPQVNLTPEQHQQQQNYQKLYSMAQKGWNQENDLSYGGLTPEQRATQLQQQTAAMRSALPNSKDAWQSGPSQGLISYAGKYLAGKYDQQMEQMNRQLAKKLEQGVTDPTQAAQIIRRYSPFSGYQTSQEYSQSIIDWLRGSMRPAPRMMRGL